MNKTRSLVVVCLVAMAGCDSGPTNPTAQPAAISALAEGLTATVNLRVVPDYQGRWEGVTRLTGYAAEGDWDGTCADVLGSGLAMTLAVTQARDVITSNVDFDDARGPVPTSILADGRLVTTGSLTLTVDGLAFDVALSEWDAASTETS